LEAGAGKLHAKVLSRFFWPEFQEQEFKVPDEITKLLPISRQHLIVPHSEVKTS
jgi:hypothetical protein